MWDLDPENSEILKLISVKFVPMPKVKMTTHMLMKEDWYESDMGQLHLENFN